MLNEEEERILAYTRLGEIHKDTGFWDREKEILGGAVLLLLLDIARDAIDDYAAWFELEFSIGTDVTMLQAEAADWARRYSFDLVKDLTDTTRKNLQKNVSAWIESGSVELGDLQKLISPAFGDARAGRISQTEVTRAWSQGRNALWRESGIVKKKRWATMLGMPNICPICQDLHGRVTVLGQPYPGHPNIFEPPDPHPGCFISPLVKVFTSRGYKQIGGIEVGDLVLTHMGRFRRVTQTIRIPKQDVEVVRITSTVGKRYSTGNRWGGPTSIPERSITVTLEHPILTKSGWKSAEQIQIGDKIEVLVSQCFECGESITFGRQFCSKPCQAAFNLRANWGNPEIRRKMIEGIEESWGRLGHREAVSEKNRISMLRQYAEGLRDPYEITKAAHEKTREMVEDGTHPFLQPEVIAKARKALGQKHYSTFLETKMAWLLDEMEIPYETQYIIYRDELRRCGRYRSQRRFYKTDFALPNEGLIIECDGVAWHSDKEYEAERDDWIRSQGWMILHFDGDRIRNDLASCSSEIRRVLANHHHEYEFMWATVSKIKRWRPNKRKTRYNLTVDEDESYIVRDIVVHNCRCFEEALVGEEFMAGPHVSGIILDGDVIEVKQDKED